MLHVTTHDARPPRRARTDVLAAAPRPKASTNAAFDGRPQRSPFGSSRAALTWGNNPMTGLGVIVHRWDFERALAARSRALFVAAVLRRLVGLGSLEGRPTCSASANGIDEGRQADDPDRGKDHEALAGPRRPPGRAVLGNVLNHRHHDVADNDHSRQGRRDGQTEGHTERPAARPPVTTYVREHVRDRIPHQNAILSAPPDQSPPPLASRPSAPPTGLAPTKPHDHALSVIPAPTASVDSTRSEPRPHKPEWPATPGPDRRAAPIGRPTQPASTAPLRRGIAAGEPTLPRASRSGRSAARRTWRVKRAASARRPWLTPHWAALLTRQAVRDQQNEP
jgi:hypothetical protein